MHVFKVQRGTQYFNIKADVFGVDPLTQKSYNFILSGAVVASFPIEETIVIRKD